MNSLGEELRALRASRGLTLAQAALRGETTAAAVGRWEAGRRLPRPGSLDRYLRGLEAPRRLTARLILDAKPNALLGPLDVLGSPASLGTALRALRKRREMTQAEIARAVEVTQSAVAKWESGHSVPPPATVHALAFALGASAEEAVALASAGGDGSAFADWREPDEAVRRLYADLAGPAEMRDAVLTAYEAEAWRRSTHDSRWDFAMAVVLANRASLEYFEGRRGLGGGAAARALRIFQTTRLHHSAMTAFEVASSLAARRGESPARFAALAGEWAPRFPDPLYRASSLAAEARGLAALGCRGKALDNVDRILEMASPECSRETLAWGRAGLNATVHLRANDPRKALAALGPAPDGPDTALLCVEVYHANELAAPDEWLETVRPHLRLASRRSWHAQDQLGALERRQASLARA